MEQVDCERLLAQPEEVLSGEYILQKGAEMDSKRDELEADAGGKSREIGVRRGDAK